MRTMLAGLMGVTALLLSGCGSSMFANEPKPAEPIQIGVSILGHAVSASPTHFGAGLVELNIANQTDRSQRVSLSSQGGGGALVSSGPINPQDTATLKVKLRQGDYAVTATSDRFRPATLHVGAPRPSAQNQLYQP